MYIDFLLSIRFSMYDVTYTHIKLEQPFRITFLHDNNDSLLILLIVGEIS